MPRAPMYQVIYDDLAGQIDSGELTPSARLPSESDLAKRYGVSRMTVRQALDRLESDQFVARQQGAGNFVTSRPPRGRYLNRLASFADELAEQAADVTSDIVQQEIVAAPDDVASALSLLPGRDVTRLLRVRRVGATPAAIQDAWIPLSVAPGLSRHSLVGGSLYRTLSEVYGVELRWADQVMTGAVLSEDSAALLGVDAGSPALAGLRSTYSSKNQIVEFTRSWTLAEFPLILRIDA